MGPEDPPAAHHSSYGWYPHPDGEGAGRSNKTPSKPLVVGYVAYSRTTAVQRLKAGVILCASIDRVRVFSICSSALLQQVFSHFGVTLLQLQASFRAIFEQVFRRLLSKFSSDFGANSWAILEQVLQRF